jgi:phage shock protein PspC (stress-responsive transcriptional regulator)/FtsH-binding integral membrane protein
MDDMSEQSGPTTGSKPGSATGGPGDQHSGPRVSAEQMRDLNRLRRSSTDRYFAGVAGGLGRHLDIDPTIIRVLLAVLTFFGGAGLLLYGAFWLFVPEDGRDRAPIELGSEMRRVILIVAAVIAGLIVFGSPFFGNGVGGSFPLFPLIVIALIGLAVYAARDQRRQTPERNQPPPPWGSTPASPTTPEGSTMSATDTRVDPGHQAIHQAGHQPPAWMPPPTPAFVPPPPRPRRTGLVLFWPTVALVAIGLGSLGIYDIDNPVTVSAYAALAVAVTAVMLLVGAFRGRPGGLIALGLVSSLALLVTSIVGAATGGTVDNRELLVRPSNPAALADGYRISNGSIQIDLSRMRELSALDGRDLTLRLNAGDITVLVPQGLNVRVDADIRYAGEISVGDVTRDGFNQSITHTVFTSSKAGTPTLDLDAHSRVGSISVEELP